MQVADSQEIVMGEEIRSEFLNSHQSFGDSNAFCSIALLAEELSLITCRGKVQHADLRHVSYLHIPAKSAHELTPVRSNSPSRATMSANSSSNSPIEACAQPIELGWSSQRLALRDIKEDWTGITNPAERRKLQNRLNQRARSE
jgi:hypothetical protein